MTFCPHHLSLALVLALGALAPACGSTSDAAPSQATATAQPAASTDDRAVCIEVMTRSRSCTEEFIPALVDARARHDQPPGIAASVNADRAAVIAHAKLEWTEDSKDEAIARRCKAMVDQMPADQRAGVATSQQCLAHTDCAAYVACIMPVLESHFAK
jgi:hypothetical protein